MLRVIKKKVQSPENHTPRVFTWTYRFHLAKEQDEISTIQLDLFEWNTVSLPKKTTLHTPKKLVIWFQKLISRKFKVQSEPFSYWNHSYHSLFPNRSQFPYESRHVKLRDVKFIVLFRSIQEELEDCDVIPPSLKLELQKQYNTFK